MHTQNHSQTHTHKHVFTDIINCYTEPSKIKKKKAPHTTKIRIAIFANAVKIKHQQTDY